MRISRCRVLIAVPLVSMLLSGCIGATDRSDFDAEVRSRGGGVTVDWITDSFDTAARSAGGASAVDLRLLSLTIDPTTRTTTVTARRVDRPDFVDVVVVREGSVISVAPIQDADDLPLDDLTVDYADLPFDRIEELTDQALEAFGEVDGYVSSIQVASVIGEVTLRVEMESARRTATAVFSQDGTLDEVLR